jgi:hypothetical protein
MDLVLQATQGYYVLLAGQQDRGIHTFSYTTSKVRPNFLQVSHSWQSPTASTHGNGSGIPQWTGYLQRDRATPICPRGDNPTFWELLQSLGGECMWEHVKDEDSDMSWVWDGMVNGMLLAVTDGSIDRTRAKDVSGLG